MDAFLDKDDKLNRSFFKKSIPLFADTLFAHLRSNKTPFMLDELHHPEFEARDVQKHGPNQVASMIVRGATVCTKTALLPATN